MEIKRELTTPSEEAKILEWVNSRKPPIGDKRGLTGEGLKHNRVRAFMINALRYALNHNTKEIDVIEVKKMDEELKRCTMNAYMGVIFETQMDAMCYPANPGKYLFDMNVMYKIVPEPSLFKQLEDKK